MLRSEKVTEIQDITARLRGAKAVIVANFRGLTVEALTKLRQDIGKADGQIKVVKNRLAKRALAEVPTAGVEEHLRGPSALATATKDPVPLAKALVDFAKDHEQLEIKGGCVEGQVLTLERLKALALLPSRAVLLAQLLGVMQGTARNLASVLAAVPRSVVTVLQAIADSKK